MQKKKFDISAKLVSPSTKAWVVHAGRGRVNYNDFAADNVVFLEAPYLNVDKLILGKREKIRRALRQSIAWREHKETTGSQPPSQNPADYSDSVFSDNALQALSGSISRLYGQAKVGDLVVVPGRDIIEGLSQAVVRIGEIVSAFDPQDVYSGGRVENQVVPTRKVKWLNVIPRRNISLLLEKKIGKPPAVREIKIDKDTEELLGHAYESYIFEGSSSGVVSANKYDGSDFIVLNSSSELIALLVSAHAAFSGGVSPPSHITDAKDFAATYFKHASVENIEVDFASPGYWRIVGATVSLAAFVGLGIAIFSSGLSADTLVKGIEVTNSVSPSDSNVKALEESMNLFLKSMDKLELEKATKTATDAKATIGLQSSTKPVN
ncbi:hypothetical protein J2Y63_006948 [Shinella sp. BE166]|uniref:hypothetical protein n=1 Tax=Shinella sp. BE166 TaxID=3373918 RepID=UPI003EC13AD4